MQHLIRQLLAELGEDPGREGLLQTHRRVEQSLQFLTSGYDWSARRAESDVSSVRGGLLCVLSEQSGTYRRTGRTTGAALVCSVL